MTKHNFLMVITSVSLIGFGINPGWQSALMFVASVVAFVVFEALIPLQEAPSKAEVSELQNNLLKHAQCHAQDFSDIKKVIEDLGNQVRVTATKLSGVKMQIGLKD